MERLELKQLQKLKEIKQQKQKKQWQVVRNILDDDYVATVFQYCKKILMEPLTQNLSDYSPSHLSKFMFEEQLQKAKAIFDTFPDQESTIEHFLLLMISIMKFPFQKWPYYLVGAKDMFNQILVQRANTISYQDFFKYVIGEVLDFKQEQQNTEFQVRFEELKKQDYLLHDTGVKKFYYSNDLKYYMTLDQSSPLIKLYNKEMRMVHKFTANKEKHNKKYPNILYFDYSEMSNKLGIVLSDSTFSIINLYNYLNKSKYDFQQNPTNQVVIHFQDKNTMVFYIQMINKWLLINQLNRMYTFDYEKYKQNDQHYMVEIKMENQDLKISAVLELVNLSMICVVAGNQVYFYNQSFGEIKHSKFVHSTDVKQLRYSDEQGLFYLCGDQKFITILTLVKATDSFVIRTFDIQSKYDVCTFDVFPTVGTIVVVDKSNDVKLFDLAQGTCYQTANYTNIVKKQNSQIKMLKISKTQFALYETYTLVFNQQKIAIQKDTQFSFLNKIYYDQTKQQFYFSVNNQIISFSVFQGQIRKSFNLETANVPKHDAFIIGKETNLFIIDHEKNIYQAFLKDKSVDGENKNYKKKIGVSRVVDMFYDQDIRYAFVVGENTVHSVRNDGLNNFTVNSVLSLQTLPQISSAKYNNHQKYILALTKCQKFLTIDTQTYRLLSYTSYSFPMDPNNHQQILIQQFQQDQYYNTDIILNNRNQLYFISRQDPKQMYVLKIQQYLPYKLKTLQFVNMRYCQVNKGGMKRYFIFSDRTGYLVEVHVTGMMDKCFRQTGLERRVFRFPLKDLHNVDYDGSKPQEIMLGNAKIFSIDKKEVNLFKGHDKEIKIMAKINIEGLRTLTISSDGQIKLWDNQQLLFFLKLPDLKKIVWNMSKIESIKNDRSINQVITVLNRITNAIQTKASPQVLLKKSNKLKNYEQVKKFNINQPIQIEIENKDLQEFVYKTQNINWYQYRNSSRKRQRDLALTQRANYHPWRTKHEFRKIMEKASPQNKYSKKMPLDLVNLRTSLDMKDRSARMSKEYQGQLTILPEINAYVAESKNYSVKEKQETQIEENENQQAFQSCLYVKNKKDRRKINEFDQIDKQFKKKWLQLTNRKWVPKSEPKKKNNADKSILGKPKAQQQKKLYYAPMNMIKYDPIKQVKSIFQNYNREASITKKGRLIKIPDIKLKRQDLFNND